MKTLLIAIMALFLLGITVPSPVCESVPETVETIHIEEEGYIDDIPFDTEQIANDSKIFEMEEEGYIDDIPFDTRKVVEDSI